MVVGVFIENAALAKIQVVRLGRRNEFADWASCYQVADEELQTRLVLKFTLQEKSDQQISKHQRIGDLSPLGLNLRTSPRTGYFGIYGVYPHIEILC